MKTILLIRHAKSSWENAGMSDEERPLNDRGLKDAPEMARRLLRRNLAIDIMYSSPAVRAFTTALIFAEVYGKTRGEVISVPTLYHARAQQFTEVILAAPAKASTIALFSHNNGITEFANMLSPARIDNMPTCAVFAVNCPIDSWASFRTGENSLYFFDFPRNKLS